MINWSSFDLNLLRVLDAMLTERNTTLVAARIGLSQPAVSSALGRLRHALGDALFVREGHRMVPTPFAESLAAPLRQALDAIERAMSGTAFDPARSTRLFRMLGDDFLAEMLLPRLVALLLGAAPGIRFQMLPSNPRTVSEQLAEAGVDLAFWIGEETPDWVDRALALTASYAFVARRGNRLLAGGGVEPGSAIPVDLFCAMPQIQFSPGGALVTREDRALAAIGRQRRVVLSVPDFFGLARIVAQTELIGALPPPFAVSIAEQLELELYSMPCEVPLEHLYLYWHRRHTDDPEHRWMRDRILELLEPLDDVHYPLKLWSAGKRERGGRPSGRKKRSART